MNPWGQLVGERPIVLRLVIAVAGTMTVVLVLAGAFVFWRVAFALDRQLDQDLAAYQGTVRRALAAGEQPPTDTPGEFFQVYGVRGRLVTGNADTRLVGADVVARAAAGRTQHLVVGHLLPPATTPYEVVAQRVRTPDGPVVLAAAISRHKHDEALRELLLQLGIADLATLLAASLVGYAVARAALNPVERYRLAAERSEDGLDSDDPTGTLPVLPVSSRRDDEITRLGHTFNDLLARIRRSNDRERQFLADASHELRSPLALMRTELEMAARGPAHDPETREALASLRGQVERLIALSDALLDLEEIRAGSRVHGERVDLAEVVASVVARAAVDPAAADRGVWTDVPEELTLTGNRHWIELALGNLVTNALVHGAGALQVLARREGADVVVTVTDEGPGFDPAFAEKAFHRFARADASRSTRGTGLGLALVLAVAEAHGGTARITDQGVQLRLPR